MRRWVLVLALAWPSLVAAGDVHLAFDYPLAAQPTARFVLRSRVVVGGGSSAVERSLPTLPPAQCQEGTPQLTADTLCADVCLPAGDYSLSVYAVDPQGATPESNILEVDVTLGGLCEPPVPVPRPAPPPRSPPVVDTAARAAILAAAAAVVAQFPGGGGPQTLADFVTLINFDCVHWSAVPGGCVCGFPPHPCIRVEYWEPAWMVETVKRPGDTVIPFLGTALNTVLAAVGLPAFGGGGAGNAATGGHTNLHFHETHVYTFPQLLGGPCTACAPGGGGPPVLNFASEMSPPWRTATALPSPTSLLPMGVWAKWYPRSGKVIHGSEPVSSGVCAARGLDIAFNPVGLPPNLEGHVVVKPTGALSTCLQLASPVQTPCFTAGTPPPLWETGTLSVGGKYLWLAWRKRECCLDTTPITCGITLPGVGRHGANSCVIPSTP